MGHKPVSKAEAKAKGQTTYDGKPCKKCGNNERHTNSGKCITCHRPVSGDHLLTAADIEREPKDRFGIHGSRIGRLHDIGREITVRVEKLNQIGAKAIDMFDSIGCLLREAETLCEPDGFVAFKERYCPELGRSRTYELLAIEQGRKTVEEIRAAGRERARRFYDKRRPLGTDKSKRKKEGPTLLDENVAQAEEIDGLKEHRRKANPGAEYSEKSREYNRQWRHRNREKQREYERQRRLQNSERKRENYRQRRLRNPEKFREYERLRYPKHGKAKWWPGSPTNIAHNKRARRIRALVKVVREIYPELLADFGLERYPRNTAEFNRKALELIRFLWTIWPDAMGADGWKRPNRQFPTDDEI